MTRKLFSLTLSAFALLLLMGAGVEQSSAALVSESDGTAAEAAVRQVLKERYRPGDIMAEGCSQVGTVEMGTLIAERV